MAWGAKSAGFRVLAGIDDTPVFLKTFSRNFPEAVARQMDLSSADPKEAAKELKLKRGELDLLIGGPPCQGFSKNVPRKQRWLEDPQNVLVRRFLDWAEFLRPQAVVMENVAEMKRGFEGAYTEEVLDRLGGLGYAAEVKVLVASDYGVPQRRRRAFFVGIQGNDGISFPTATHAPLTAEPTLFVDSCQITVWDAIGDLPSLKQGEGRSPTDYDKEPRTDYQRLMRARSERLFDHVARPLQPKQLERLAALKPGEGAKHLPRHLQPKSHYSGAYGRLEKKAIAPTITRWVFHPGSGRFGHPVDARVITIREAARLQSFSDDFVFEGTYIQKSHQVGNAVPPLLMEALARPLCRRLA